MKNFTYLFLFLTIALSSFKAPGEESMYDGTKVSYNVAKENGVVTINLGLKDPQNFETITIMRSDNPSKYFRDVKLLTPEEVSEMTFENVLVDKYPLPSSMITYYKVQTTDKSGVQRTYPSVKLASR